MKPTLKPITPSTHSANPPITPSTHSANPPITLPTYPPIPPATHYTLKIPPSILLRSVTFIPKMASITFRCSDTIETSSVFSQLDEVMPACPNIRQGRQARFSELGGLRALYHPYVVEAQFPWGTLPFDMQELIRDHTATSFAVESDFTMRFRFPEVSWANVQYVIRYEFKLMPPDLSTRPEIEVRVTRVLDPAFKQSRVFIESDVSMQEMLVNNFKEIKFSAISGVKLEMRHESGAPLHFVKFVSRENGVEHVFRTPFWSIIERSTI